MGMTESPQQPGYQSAPQQQAAYTGQQQAYAPQAYAQPTPNPFDKLPMNMQTFGLAAGGALLLFISSLIHGAGDLNFVLVLRGISPFSLAPMYAILILTAVTVVTGAKFRNVYRAVVTGLALVEIGMTVSMFMSKLSVPDPTGQGGGGSVDTGDGATMIGIILYVLAIGCLTAATFTMADKPTVDPQQLAAMQAAQAQQHAAAAQQAAAQQQYQDQYQASQGLQQPGAEPPTTWQQQPPQQ